MKLEEEALSLVMSRLVVVFRLQEVSIQLVVTRLLVGTRILGIAAVVEVEAATSLARMSKIFSTLMLGTAMGASSVSGSSRGL